MEKKEKNKTQKRKRLKPKCDDSLDISKNTRRIAWRTINPQLERIFGRRCE